MKIFFSILFNALLLFAITYFIPWNPALNEGVNATGGVKLFFIGGVVLGILNFIVRPLLKLIGLPFILVTFGLFILVINGIILFLLEKIIAGLNIAGVVFQIKGVPDFIIAVAIFTVFNIIYNTFLKK